MRFLSLRQWFQFRLSTWFVLVAILALWMTAKPAVSFDSFSTQSFSNEDREERLKLDVYTRTHKPAMLKISSCWLGIGHNPQLMVAVQALAALVAWKSAVAIKGQIVRHLATSTTAINQPPPRCWYRWRWSTWLLLAAILGVWLMGRPSCSIQSRTVQVNGNVAKPEEVVVSLGVFANDPQKYGYVSAAVGFERNPNRQSMMVVLLVLLVASLVGPRIIRRRQSAASE